METLALQPMRTEEEMKLINFSCDNFRNTEGDSIALLAASPYGSATSTPTSRGDGKRVRSLKGDEKYGRAVICYIADSYLMQMMNHKGVITCR